MDEQRRNFNLTITSLLIVLCNGQVVNQHERVSIKSGKRNFQPIFKSAKYFSRSIRSFGSPSASKRNSISTMDNNLTFHVSSRSRFATISSVQPKKKKKIFPLPFIFIIPVSSNNASLPGRGRKKIAKLSKTSKKKKEKQMKTAR